MSSLPAPWDGSRLRLWGSCGLLVLVLHLGGGTAALLWRGFQPATPPPPPAAMMIELAPLPTAMPTPVNTAPPAPEKQTPAPAHKAIERQPDPPPMVKKAEVALPKPRPAERKPQPDAPPKEQPKAEETAQPPVSDAPPAQQTAAPDQGESPPSPSTAVPTWQGVLLGHLEKHKRYPATARARGQQGSPVIRFVMDRSGKVLSVRLERSSGTALLDEEGVALINRAQPLPPPPPEVKGEQIEIAVPIQFLLR